jgi:hypothetical protein
MELIVVALIGTFALLLWSFAAYLGSQIFGTRLYTARNFQGISLPRPKAPPSAPLHVDEAEARLRPAA